MSLQTEIRFIDADHIKTLRRKVLKPFLTLDECVLPEDLLATTFHLGLFHHQKLVSIATFVQQASPYFASGFPYRLRGMATDESYRGQGLGSQILRFGFHVLKEKRADLLWCNARILAFTFYQAMGFQPHGDLFDIKDIGPHKVMYKIIIPR